MNKQSYDVLILSDLHLGSELSAAKSALELLNSLEFRKLILLGDIFCDLNFRRLNRDHWDFLSCIRKLSNPRRNVDVVWVEGNHDFGLIDVLSHLVGIPAYREYVWEADGLRHMAIHGHQFDSFTFRNDRAINRIAGSLYLLLQAKAPRGVSVARMLDRLNTRWQRLTPKVAEGAIAYARTKNADFVYCGHTHEAAHCSKDGIYYCNAGAWTHGNTSYITISRQEVTLHDSIGRIIHCHSSEERRKTAAAAVVVNPAAGLSTNTRYEYLPG